MYSFIQLYIFSLFFSFLCCPHHLVSPVTGLLNCQSRDDLNNYFDLLRINQSSISSLKWMGGDISTSIPLSLQTTTSTTTTVTPYLWLFGDTCGGHLTQSGDGSSIVKKFQFTSNTVAIQNMLTTTTTTTTTTSTSTLTTDNERETSFDEPQFYLPLNHDGSLNSQGIFVPPHNATNVCPSPHCKYWCISGIHLTNPQQADDTLVLFCQTPTQTDLASQYTTVVYINNITSSATLLSTSNTLTDVAINPLAWTYQSTYLPSPYSGHDYGWGTSLVKNHEDGLIYLVGQNNSHSNLFDIGIYLARISEQDLLASNWLGMQVFCNNGQWMDVELCVTTHGLNNLIGFPSSYTETSLVYSDIIQQWVLILLDTGGNTVYTALTPILSQPTFPTWKVVPIYDIGAPFNNKSAGLFNYAAKIHTQFSTLSTSQLDQHEHGLNNNNISATIVFSFNTNGPFNDLTTDLDIYHPHFVECQLDV